MTTWAGRNGPSWSRAHFSGAARYPVSPLVLIAAVALVVGSAPILAFADPAKPGSVKPPPAQVERIQKTYAESILGRPVLDEKGQTIGHIVDVLVDVLGNPHAAIVEFEGFLGVGNRKVAVAWSALRFALNGDRMTIKVAMDAAELRKIPEYKPSAESVPVAAPAPTPPGGASESR